MGKLYLHDGREAPSGKDLLKRRGPKLMTGNIDNVRAGDVIGKNRLLEKKARTSNIETKTVWPKNVYIQRRTR